MSSKVCPSLEESGADLLREGGSGSCGMRNKHGARPVVLAEVLERVKLF